MSKEDKPPPSPNHGLYDPAHLLGAPHLGLGGLPFPHLAHLPAFPWLAQPPLIPPSLFGGLGALPSPLLTHGLAPTTADYGGSEWWRAASEHARRAARSSGVDYFAASLGGPPPPLPGLGLESSAPTGLEFLLAAPVTEGDASALFGMSKHLSELPSTSAASPSPSRRSRTSTPTPAPAHQKSSTSKTSHTSTASSSSTSSKDPGYRSSSDKGSWHVNGSAFSLKSLSSSDQSASRKRAHKEEKTPSRSISSSLFSLPSSSATSTSRSYPTPPAKSSVPSASKSRVSERSDGGGALNLTKPSVAHAPMKSPPPVTPGVQDLSMKKPASQTPPARHTPANRTPASHTPAVSKTPASHPKATNGSHLTDSDSPNVSTPGSADVSDDSDNDLRSKPGSKGSSQSHPPGHQIDGSKRQLLADQIRQQLMTGTSSSSSPLSTPLVIPSLPPRREKGKEQKKAAHNASHYSLLSLSNEFPGTEAYFAERDLLNLASASASHDAAAHSAALSAYLSGERVRQNSQSNNDSQDSLDDSKFETSGSERPMDSESQSGWGSDDDGSQVAGSSASPGPSGDDTSKKRNIVLNERELLIPLEHGWRRQTTIHGMGRRGIVGEVLYFAPCSKKMKTIPDVMRYLDRHGITDLSRENFTFNTKVNIGQFFEIRDGKVVPLTEIEIQERIAMSKGKRARMQMLARKKQEKQMRQQALAKQVMEAKLKKRQEQQDMARKAAEMKFQMRLEKEQQKEIAKKVKEHRLMERQREKEQARLMKQQEKVRQQEQIRIEREMRAQQIIEARRRRQTELEEIRMKEIMRKNKEREIKRQQQMIEKEHERERRRQHLMLVKALEQQKKEEERLEKERIREQKLREKELERERKLAQRQIEIFIAEEMKKPMDDMELRNGKPLPEFARCPEAKLAGPAFSDCLMIVEFIHNFAEALGLDPDNLLTLEKLQNGLAGTNEEDVEEMVTLYLHLLRFALDDLGVPNPKEAVTVLNQKITDLEINDATMSEVTRIFLKAHGEKKMSQWLETTPLEALNPTKKAAIIAFLVNELLSSKRISGEIEKTLETINTLRRDKWVAEGKLRKLKTARAKKYMRVEHLHQSHPPPTDEDSMTNTTAASSKAASDDEEEKEEDDEEEEEESGEESDATHTTGKGSEDEDDGLSKEDMDKKIDKLSKQHNSYDSKVADVSKHLRGVCLGQDRYKRLYWILPHTGGIFVEGIESGETEALAVEAELLARQKAKKIGEAAKIRMEKGEPVVKLEKLDPATIKKEMTEAKSQGKVADSKVAVGDSKAAVDSSRVEVKMEVEESVARAVKVETVESSVVKREEEKMAVSDSDVSVKTEKVEGGLNGCETQLFKLPSTSSGLRSTLSAPPPTSSAPPSTTSTTQASGIAVNGSQVNSMSQLPARTPTPTSQAAQLTQVSTVVKTDTEDTEPAGKTNSAPSKNKELAGKTDSADSRTVVSTAEISSTVSHSNVLLQEPILSKLTGLLKLPQTDSTLQGSQTLSSTETPQSSSSVSSRVTSVSQSSLPSVVSTSSVTAASTVTTMASVTVSGFSIPTPVIATVTTPSVTQTDSATGTTAALSQPQTVTTIAETKQSAPQGTRSSMTGVPVSSTVSAQVLSVASSSVLSVTSSPITTSAVVSTAVICSTTNSSVSQASTAVLSQSTISSSHPSSVSQSVSAASEVSTPVTAKSDLTVATTACKTLPVTSAVPSTPVVTSVSGSGDALSTTANMDSTPVSSGSNVLPTTTGVEALASTPVAVGKTLKKDTVLASTPITCSPSTPLSSSHVVSLLSGLPITSPIQSATTPVKGDKKTNFVSIDSLLKKKSGGGTPTVSSSSSTTTTSITTTTTVTTTSAATGTDSSSDSVKNHTSANNHFLPPNLYPPSPLVSEYFLKSYADILDQKPWFSILPRLPCDESQAGHKSDATTTTTQSRISSMVSSDNIASASLSLLSLLPMHAMNQAKAQSSASQTPTTPSQLQASPRTQTPSQTGDFSSFQASLSQSSFADTSSMSTATNTMDMSSCMDSFKVPAPPSDSLFGDLDPYAELRKVQGEAQPIPISKQRGWWKVTDLEQVRQLYNSLLSRGVREKNMAYSLRKYNELCTQVCTEDSGKAKNVKKEMKEEASQSGEDGQKPADGEKEMDTSTASNTDPNKTDVKEEKMDTDKTENKTENKTDGKKNDEETTDEKKDEEKKTDEKNADEKKTDEKKDEEKNDESKEEQKKTNENRTEEKDISTKNEQENKKQEEPMQVDREDIDNAIPADPEDSWNVKAGFEVEMACLEDVEALEDRVFNASLQAKAWKLPQRATEDPEIRLVDRFVVNPTPPECYPMDVARSRLLMLESNIERRYLKPPLMRNVQLHLVNIPPITDTKSTAAEKSDKSADGHQEKADEVSADPEHVTEQYEDVPPGLLLWRRAVQTAVTPAQLNLCTQQLGSSIAWEKSIMKVMCQICLKDDNEAELLLCDGCDRGYHTYCFKPKMETIPEGDWYCYECVTKASGVPHCIVCGQKTGKIVVCDRCPRAVHLDCLDPPLPRMPKKWQCATCLSSKSKKSAKRKRKDAPALPIVIVTGTPARERKESMASSTKEQKESESTADAPPPEKKKRETTRKTKAKEEKKKEEKVEKKTPEKRERKESPKKTKKKKDEEPRSKDGDLTVCSKLLTELEKSDDGWPFLKPVSTKQFPTYKKFISQPMDFQTMKGKLKDKMYKHRSEFAADIRLVLDNCETFNEDDSEVGQAGHSLRKLFRQRWRELFSEDS